MTIILSGYNYTLKYRRGENHGNVVGLSRLRLKEHDKEKEMPTELPFLWSKSSNTRTKKEADFVRITRSTLWSRSYENFCQKLCLVAHFQQRYRSRSFNQILFV